MADLMHITAGKVHIRIKIPEARWQQYASLFPSQPQALCDLRRRIDNQMSAAIIANFEALLEASYAAAKDSDNPR